MWHACDNCWKFGNKTKIFVLKLAFPMRNDIIKNKGIYIFYHVLIRDMNKNKVGRDERALRLDGSPRTLTGGK